MCHDAPDKSLKHLVGVEKGADVMEDTFKWLGYATLRLTDATGRQLRAMIRAASEVEYPDSYKRIFFHFIGHGVEGAVYTEDDCILLSDIVQPFKRIPQIPKVFIFDCCRQFSSVPSSLSLTAENTLIMYSTMPGCKAYAPTDLGSLMTNKLAHLFRNERDSIANLESKLSSDLKGYDQVFPLVMFQLNQPISLLEEQEDKSMFRLCMSKNINITEYTWFEFEMSLWIVCMCKSQGSKINH